MTPELLGQARDFLKQNSFAETARIAVVGDLALDRFVFGKVERISPEAPVPVLLTEKTFVRPGCAANVVENLLQFSQGWKLHTDLLGVVGDDLDGRTLVENLSKNPEALDLHIFTDRSRPTIVKTRYLAGNPDNLAGSQHPLLRVDTENSLAISDETEEALMAKLEPLWPKLKTLVIQDYSKGLLKKRLLSWLLIEARKRKVFTILDPNINTPGILYTGADLMTPNVLEASKLLDRSLGDGSDNQKIAEAAAELKKRYDLKAALITRSAHGMTLLDEQNQTWHFPAIARRVYDVTGAGDTVVSLLAACLARGLKLAPSCVVALAGASVVVGKVGTAHASLEEISKELQALKSS